MFEHIILRCSTSGFNDSLKALIACFFSASIDSILIDSSARVS